MWERANTMKASVGVGRAMEGAVVVTERWVLERGMSK
jgi:hypothetical protein